MSDEQQSLIKYEPDPIVVSETWIERKRRELREAIERGEVKDPISILVSIGISLAVSGLSYGLTRLFAPQAKPIEKGRTTGSLVISSQLGVLIPECYFGDPGDGLGGTWLPSIVISLSEIVKQVNVSRQSTGGGKGGGGQTQEVREIVYLFPYLAVMYGRGPLRALKLRNNSDIVFDLYGQVSKYEAEDATLAGSTAFDYDDNYSGGRDVSLNPAASVEWPTIQSNGAATRQVSFRYRTATSTAISAELTLNGVMQVISFPGSSGVFRAYSIALALLDGANVIKVKNTHGSLVLAIDYLYAFPGHVTGSTGVLDPVIDPDDPYDPGLPPNPNDEYQRPHTRFDADPDRDEFSAQSGTMLHGGNVTFIFYEGNYEQLPDPTMSAAVDAIHGADSTPAYRGRAYEVNSQLYLTRWGNAIPNKTGLFENVVIKTFGQFCGVMSSRVVIVTADYNYSAFDLILPRGLRVLGQRFAPKDLMEQGSTLFNCFFTEEDFQIVGKLNGGASVATLTDEDFGWIEGDEIPEVLSSIDIPEQDATKLPARTELKHLDLDRDGDPGLEGYGRHETVGVETETLDYSDWTFVPDEAKEIAQRIHYQRYGEKPLKFVVSWKYLWFVAGDVFTAILTRTGFTYEIQIDKIAGGVGIQECEGHLVDTPIYTQPVTTGSGVFGAPVVPLPQMTIAALMDTPLLRDRDATENNGIGFYATGTPRTGDGVWTGSSLYVNKVGWERIADFTLPATMGRQVLANGSGVALPTVSDPSVFDRVNTITADFYGTRTPPASVSEEEVFMGANPLLVGDEFLQYATRTQVGGFPNRWTFSTLLRGRRGTETKISTHVLNERVVVFDEAIMFIPISINDVNQPREYRMVSNGQSLDDAAIVEFPWTGGTLRTLAPDILKGVKLPNGDWRFTCHRRSRIGQGLRPNSDVPLGEERSIFDWEILDGSDVKHSVRIFGEGVETAALLDRSNRDTGGVVTFSRHITVQRLEMESSYVTAEMETGGLLEPSVGIVDFVGSGMVDDGVGNIVFNAPFLMTAYFAAGDVLTIVENGVVKYTAPSSYVGASANLRVSIENGALKYFLNYENEGTVPVYVSTRTDLAGRDLRGYFGADDGTTGQRVKIKDISYTYPLQDQEDEFGSEQMTIKVRVYQVSSIVGRGDYSERTFP